MYKWYFNLQIKIVYFTESLFIIEELVAQHCHKALLILVNIGLVNGFTDDHVNFIYLFIYLFILPIKRKLTTEMFFFI